MLHLKHFGICCLVLPSHPWNRKEVMIFLEINILCCCGLSPFYLFSYLLGMDGAMYSYES